MGALMPVPATHVTAMRVSGIRQIMDMAWTMPGPVIGLHVGEPSFSTPEHILAAASEAMERGETRYVPNAGVDELLQAIADKVSSLNGFAVGPDRVVVSAGGMQAINLALSATVSAGDEVLVPDPGWPNFEMATRLLQAEPVRYPLVPDHAFLPDVAVLDSLVTERTRALVVNSPSNPLGTMLDAKIAEQLCRFADRHDLWLVSDECYDAIVFDTEHVSPARFDTEQRVLSCFSFSKTYAMTGMRVGYLVAPGPVAETATKMQEPILSCVNAPAQYAALAALRGPQDAVEEMRTAYHRRRDAAADLLRRRGIGYTLPRGSFYLWVDVRERCGGDVAEWAVDLLRRTHVAVAPGSAFGPSGEGWVRTSLATEEEQLLDGLERLAGH
jgi:aspartate aminotransferase